MRTVLTWFGLRVQVAQLEAALIRLDGEARDKDKSMATLQLSYSTLKQRVNAMESEAQVRLAEREARALVPSHCGVIEVCRSMPCALFGMRVYVRHACSART